MSDSARPAENSLEGKSRSYVTRIESIMEEIATLTGSHMQACKALRDDIKEIYVEAKGSGIPVKPLKGLVRYRELMIQQDKIAAGMKDADEQQVYEQLIDALGDLGRAAASKAGYTVAARDVIAKGDALTKGEPTARADQTALDQVGRGKDVTDSIAKH